MADFRIKSGKDIRMDGVASSEILELDDAPSVALYPLEFKGINPRLTVKVGEEVKKGQIVIEDKSQSGVCVVAPVSGVVSAINRGQKRKLITVVFESRPEISPVKHDIPEKLDRSSCVNLLKKSGMWTLIRQRPFSKILNPDIVPQAIFVKAFYSEPLALDLDCVVADRGELFQKGLDCLKKLTENAVHLCCSSKTQSKVFLNATGVEKHMFSGPHPSGNVSTFVHKISPIQKDSVVAYLDAQDVLALGEFLTSGIFSSKRIFAITGSGLPLEKRIYVKTDRSSSLDHLLQGAQIIKDNCYLSGNVLSGFPISETQFVRYYDSQIHVIPDRSERKLLKFFGLGLKEFTISRTYGSSFLRKKDEEFSLDTSIHGSDRAIVLNDIYDRYVALDIYTYFLLKAILAQQWDEAEALGLLECDPEDFALASFACPSKVDVMGIVAHGLDFFEKEG